MHITGKRFLLVGQVQQDGNISSAGQDNVVFKRFITSRGVIASGKQLVAIVYLNGSPRLYSLLIGCSGLSGRVDIVPCRFFLLRLV